MRLIAREGAAQEAADINRRVVDAPRCTRRRAGSVGSLR